MGVFTFLKLYVWYQIAQSVSYIQNPFTPGVIQDPVPVKTGYYMIKVIDKKTEVQKIDLRIRGLQYVNVQNFFVS